MQKVKHDFQVANREISFGNVCMIHNCFISFDRNSCLTFKLSTACSIQLWTSCTQFYNQTRSQSRNEINTHTEHLVQKHNDLLYLKRSYLVLNEEKKQGDKKEKLTDSLYLRVKIARRANYNIDLRKLRVNKITCRRWPQSSSKWKTYRLSAMILHSQLNVAFRFRRQEQFCCLR